MADSVVDCHVQVWDPATVHYPWMPNELARSAGEWRLSDVEVDLRDREVHRVVLVQSADNIADSEHMLFQALTSPRVAGVVAWVPLTSPEQAATQLHAWRHEPVVGVGHRVHDEPDPDWLRRPAIDDSLAMLTERRLTFDVTAFTGALLGHVAALAERHPKLSFVVAHLGRPPLARRTAGVRDGWDEWVRRMSQLAQLPNVVVKISGLGAELGPGWTATDAQPAVDVVLERFGPDRAMVGSDWPSVRLAGDTYRRVWDALRGTLDGLDANARALVLGGTANRVYGLPLD
jgi:L-fuconolactonase